MNYLETYMLLKQQEEQRKAQWRKDVASLMSQGLLSKPAVGVQLERQKQRSPRGTRASQLSLL